MSLVFLTAKYAKTAKSLYGLFLLVRAVRVVRGSYIFNRSVRCRGGGKKGVPLVDPIDPSAVFH